MNGYLLRFFVSTCTGIGGWATEDSTASNKINALLTIKPIQHLVARRMRWPIKCYSNDCQLKLPPIPNKNKWLMRRLKRRRSETNRFYTSLCCCVTERNREKALLVTEVILSACLSSQWTLQSRTEHSLLSSRWTLDRCGRNHPHPHGHSEHLAQSDTPAAHGHGSGLSSCL